MHFVDFVPQWIFDKCCLHAKITWDIPFSFLFYFEQFHFIALSKLILTVFQCAFCLLLFGRHQTNRLSIISFSSFWFKQFKYDDYFDVSSHQYEWNVNKWILILLLAFHCLCAWRRAPIAVLNAYFVIARSGGQFAALHTHKSIR